MVSGSSLGSDYYGSPEYHSDPKYKDFFHINIE